MRKSLLRWMNELRRQILKEDVSPCVRGKLTIPSLIVSEGKKHNGKPVPYVTGRISEAGAASLSASVPFIQLHAVKIIHENELVSDSW